MTYYEKAFYQEDLSEFFPHNVNKYDKMFQARSFETYL